MMIGIKSDLLQSWRKYTPHWSSRAIKWCKMTRQRCCVFGQSHGGHFVIASVSVSERGVQRAVLALSQRIHQTNAIKMLAHQA